MSREFDENLKAKWAREDKQKQKDYIRAEALDTYETISHGMQALSENSTLLDRTKNPVLWNFNGAFISLFSALRKIEKRLDILENKVDVIRRDLKEDKY